jgi:hypothetical protein
MANEDTAAVKLANGFCLLAIALGVGLVVWTLARWILQ